jgi:hypothetical protein
MHKIFTVAAGEVTPGAQIQEFTLKGADTRIPAILIGEEGRGRRLGVLPVSGAAPKETLLAAQIGQTRTGNPKLIAASDGVDDSAVIVVLRTPIGFRGSNVHTGDRSPEWTEDTPNYLPFPGHTLVGGRIAQGEAGAMGSGDQYVALIPRGAVFRTAYTGRLYGAPTHHYYMWDGHKLLAATWQERALTEIF